MSVEGQAINFEDMYRRIAREEALKVFAESRAPSPNESKYLTVKEASEVTSHPVNTIRHWLATKKIPNYGHYRRPRVRLSDILNLNP